MSRRRWGVAALAVGALSASLAQAPANADVETNGHHGYSKTRTVGYFIQWGVYDRNFRVKNLVDSGAAARLTHLNYAFGFLDESGKCISADPWADWQMPYTAEQSVSGQADEAGQALMGNLNQLKQLKAKYPKLRINISLGGWTGSRYFSNAALDDVSRAAHVKSCTDMWIKGNLPGLPEGAAKGVFDGIDLDWEWPGAEGHAGNHFGPQDKVNNSLLIEEFRRQLDALGATTGKRYQLTAFTPADPAKIAAGWELGRVAQSMDIFNVQGYDFHGSGSDNSWEPNRTGHQGNLHPDPDDPYPFHFDVASTVQAYLDAGVPSRRITLGLAFYGRGWQNVTDGGKNGEWQPAGGAAPGQFPEEAGTRGYANLVASVPNCTVHHDEVAVATSCYTGNQWWTFDDAWSIQRKTAWLKSKNLLGAMFWEMSGDRGPLMAAVDAGLR
jgi:chitinase